MPWNFYTTHLSSISLAFQYDLTIDVLYELRKTIERLQDKTHDIAKDLGQDNAELIWEDANSIVDDLHGAAFVICQASITAVVSRIKALHAFAKGVGKSISSVPNDRSQILTFKSPVIPSKAVTQIQAIDALANYFKHHDEWHAGWVNPDNRSKATITTLQALGFQYGNRAILTDALKLFDPNLLVLANAVNVWHEAILKELKKELTSLGLV